MSSPARLLGKLVTAGMDHDAIRFAAGLVALMDEEARQREPEPIPHPVSFEEWSPHPAWVRGARLVTSAPELSDTPKAA